MTSRVFLWAGTAIDAVLFLAGAYMAVGALDVARVFNGSASAVAIAGLFLALPVFCIACPLAAWRAHGRGRGNFHVASLMLAPVVYALFLTIMVSAG